MMQRVLENGKGNWIDSKRNIITQRGDKYSTSKEISEDKESANVRQQERYVSPSREHIEEDEHIVQGRTGKKLTGKSQMGEWYKIQQNCYRAKDEECEVQGLIQRLM
uniref:Uncharacterized protein n=1 Tax=Rhizophagus irregularis (strain DAOM 181602 / DAOM 197198 / MUCL 43194) TaxID=747089 RepID=U9TQQ6_RHIID